MEEENRVSVEVRMDYTWITLPGILNMDNYHYIEQQIESRLAGKPKRVVLDLIYFNQLYSTGISLIIRLNKRIVEAGGLVCLVNVSQKCSEYLTSVHLDKVLPFFASDLEFEISQDKIEMKQDALKDRTKFICATIKEKDVCHITLSGEMTVEHNLLRYRHTIFKKNITNYVFDLTSLDMIDSSGACLFRDIISEINENEAECVAYGSNNVITKLLKLLSIDKIMPLYKTERQALKALGEE